MKSARERPINSRDDCDPVLQFEGGANSDIRSNRTRLKTHAILITAYKDYPSLSRLVARFDPIYFRLFIHVDKRSRFTKRQLDELRDWGSDVRSVFPFRYSSGSTFACSSTGLLQRHSYRATIQESRAGALRSVRRRSYRRWLLLRCSRIFH